MSNGPTGRDNTQRREWIHRLEMQLASLFAVDVGFHTELGNHLHLIVRTRPDVVPHWSDEEVTRRWLIIAKLKRLPREELPVPTQHEIEQEMRKPGRIQVLRERLSDLSWFAGTLEENISRQVNADQGTHGRVWEERFQCRELVDIAAILICALYLDLNQIRAGEALTPEESCYTSAYDRIMARLWRLKAWAFDDPAEAGDLTGEWSDEWLSPLSLSEAAEEEVLLGRPSKSGKRCSDKGMLEMGLDEYLQMLDFVGRQLREGKRGAIPADLAPILERLRVRAEGLVDAVEGFGERFGRFAGSVEHVAQRLAQRGLRRIRGLTECADAFL
jgi:hypothetical protein